MVSINLTLACLLCSFIMIGAEHVKEPSNDREGKVLSLFNIVTFKNEACQSNNVISGGGINGRFRGGTCFTTAECAQKNGQAGGTCASGFGVCCIFTAVNSGSTITQNCTYIRNPGFPQTYEQQSSITYTIRKTAPDVCSLRLDFESFSILATGNTLETNTILIPPTTGGICLDQLNIVLSSGVSVPTICGQNSGEHIYLDIGNQATSRAQLNFVFDAQVSNIRQWEIKAVQIPCTSSVPQGCLQYHTGASGTLRTFNFLNNADNHLANQDYSICIRQEAGFCCVEYLPCVDVNAFSLDVQATTSLVDSSCSLDHISIDGAMSVCGCGLTTTKFCGQALNPIPSVTSTSVCDCSAPFSVHVFTDGATDLAAHLIPSRGLCLNYRQKIC